jgi:hypothetical protein
MFKAVFFYYTHAHVGVEGRVLQFVCVFEDIYIILCACASLSLLNYLMSDNIPKFLYGRKEASLLTCGV